MLTCVYVYLNVGLIYSLLMMAKVAAARNKDTGTIRNQQVEKSQIVVVDTTVYQTQTNCAYLLAPPFQ